MVVAGHGDEDGGQEEEEDGGMLYVMRVGRVHVPRRMVRGAPGVGGGVLRLVWK